MVILEAAVYGAVELCCVILRGVYQLYCPALLPVLHVQNVLSSTIDVNHLNEQSVT